jgi:hypothetical protein
MSRDHGEEDIASSREPSPSSNGRRQGPDPMETLEASEPSSKPRDDHVHPWPVLKPTHSVPVLATDGTPLEPKEVTFSPSGKMLAVCCESFPYSGAVSVLISKFRRRCCRTCIRDCRPLGQLHVAT